MIGMPKLTSDKEKLLRDTLIRFPAYTDKKIATQLSLNRTTVAKYRKNMDLKYDSDFISITAGKWIKYYNLASDLFLKYITQIEEYKESGTKTIVVDKGTVKIPLSGMEKGQLTKIQGDILTKLCEDAGNGEVREVIRMMRVGKIPTLT